MLSVILPAYKEPQLRRTIEGILDSFHGNDFEVIAVLDGYWIKDPIEDPRVHYLHIGKKSGMRNTINQGVRLSRGDVLMKTDAHCMFCKGFNTIEVGDKEVIIPRRFFLDTEKWEVMDKPYVDYEKLTIHSTRGKFHGEPWKSLTKERKDIVRDETMAFQGSCWLMRRSLWDEAIGSLDDTGYGDFVMEPVEIAFKTWGKGGKLIIEKRFWYAHKDRSFNRTHNIPREEADRGNDYALALWGAEFDNIRKKWGV